MLRNGIGELEIKISSLEKQTEALETLPYIELTGQHLNQLNAEIQKYNSSKDITKRYKILVELFFNVNALIASNADQTTISALENWLRINSIEEKIKAMAHKIIQVYLSTDKSTFMPIFDKRKPLIDSLSNIKKIANTQTLDNTSLIENFTSSCISKLNKEKFAYYSFINNIINQLIEIKNYILRLSMNHKIKKEELEKLKDLYLACDHALYESIKFIKHNKDQTALLRHVVADKLTLPQNVIDRLHRLDAPLFCSLQEGFSKSFTWEDISFKYLGGGTNLVYKIAYSEENQLIIKLYPNYEEYTKGYDTLIQVRNHLGNKAATIIGHIYFEKEFIEYDKDATEDNIRGRLEIAEYFPKGSLENVINENIKFHDLMRKEDVIFKEIQEKVINYALKISQTIFHLMQANVVCTDIKPTNIFIVGNDQVRIPDYKTMFVIDSTQNVPLRSIFYTRQYIPPEIEQLENNLVNSREKDSIACNVHDLQKYALGLTLYELATGDFAYKHKKSKYPPNFSHFIFRGIKGNELLNVIQSLMKDDPAKRIEVEEAMERLSNAINMQEPESSVRFKKSQSGHDSSFSKNRNILLASTRTTSDSHMKLPTTSISTSTNDNLIIKRPS